MAKINQNIFRAYDIRGIYPRDLNGKVASKIALALIDLYPNIQKVVLAHDTRKSSLPLSQAISNALVKEGKEVIFLGTAPDPLFYFSIFHYGFDAGIMISGSHNPRQYNGITLHVKKKGDIVEKNLEAIKNLVLKERKAKIKKQGRVVIFNPEKDYLNYVAEKINLKKPLKVLIDSGNGAMGYLPEKVFKRLGCRVKTIYGEFDGSFPHHLPDPYEEKNRIDAEKAVLKGKFDIGFVYDGDGDRVIAIDNLGRPVTGSCRAWRRQRPTHSPDTKIARVPERDVRSNRNRRQAVPRRAGQRARCRAARGRARRHDRLRPRAAHCRR